MNLVKKSPFLTENAFLRYVVFSALYFAEGLNMGLLFVGLPAWLAMKGKTPTEIGGFAVACALPWTFKFVVAPLMDRYTYLPMGRKRPWVLVGQLGLMISLIFMAYLPDPLSNMQQFNIAAFVVSAFGAIHDAATDGLAVDTVPADQQARTNGFMGGARMIGSSLALALGSWLLNKYGFTAEILGIACLIGLAILVPFFLRERPGEKLVPWTAGAASREAKKMQVRDWTTLFRSLYGAFRLRDSLIIIVLLFITQGAYNYFETLLPLFTVKETGWTNIIYARFFATADLTGGIAGMLIGGYLIEKFGRKRMMNGYFLLIILITVGLAFIKPFWTNSHGMVAFIITYRWLNAFAKIGLFAIAMECCLKKVSASQFTIYMTMGAIGSLGGATLIGPIKEHFSWEITFCSFAAMIALAWVILQFLNLNKLAAQITALEEKDVKREVVALVEY